MINCILKLNAFVLFFLISTIPVFSQDTIFYKKAGNIVVIVKEVAQTEVQYKKLEMPDGPMYIINKSDIEKIVYKNGYTEIIKAPVVETEAAVEQPFSVTYSEQRYIGQDKISYRSTAKRYNGLVSLVDRHPDPNRRPELMNMAGSMRNYKTGVNTTRTLAIVFGAVTLPVLIVMTDFISDETIFVVPATTAAIALICTAASITFSVNLKQKRKAFVDLYNK